MDVRCQLGFQGQLEKPDTYRALLSDAAHPHPTHPLAESKVICPPMSLCSESVLFRIFCVHSFSKYATIPGMWPASDAKVKKTGPALDELTV